MILHFPYSTKSSLHSSIFPSSFRLRMYFILIFSFSLVLRSSKEWKQLSHVFNPHFFLSAWCLRAPKALGRSLMYLILIFPRLLGDWEFRRPWKKYIFNPHFLSSCCLGVPKALGKKNIFNFNSLSSWCLGAPKALERIFL